MNEKEIAQLIDHTLLKPDASFTEIEALCAQAMYYGFKTVRVNSSWVSTAQKFLTGSGVGITSVIGFPLGAMNTEGKLYEMLTAVEDGATELDFVINLGLLKSGNYDKVLEELHHLIDRAVPSFYSETQEIITKVIIETSLLNDDEKAIATQLSVEAGANFVKTSTGFNGGGATVEDIYIMLDNGAREVKASGGVNTLEKFNMMIEAGATRVGTSSGIKIIGSMLEV
jgi:deoxyribose-phosphate aldolase